ncbi:Protein of unknown function [Lactobacillus delbrueckii subsp. bulgaricus]|nr:Protein of unknown function [Lactobacillus delbrueckii subsp. bulgaricus]
MKDVVVDFVLVSF